MKMYIAILDEFPDYMTPTLVGHAVIGHHIEAQDYGRDEWKEDRPYTTLYKKWLRDSFKKCTLRVNQKEFDKIAALPNVGLFHENNTLDGRKACAVLVVGDDVPNVLKFGKLWSPLNESK